MLQDKFQRVRYTCRELRTFVVELRFSLTLFLRTLFMLLLSAAVIGRLLAIVIEFIGSGFNKILIPQIDQSLMFYGGALFVVFVLYCAFNNYLLHMRTEDKIRSDDLFFIIGSPSTWTGLNACISVTYPQAMRVIVHIISLLIIPVDIWVIVRSFVDADFAHSMVIFVTLGILVATVLFLQMAWTVTLPDE